MLGECKNGHTSIYVCDYIRENRIEFNTCVASVGFKSYNSFINNLQTEWFSKQRQLLNPKPIKNVENINIHDDVETIKHKLKSYSDGNVLDLFKKTDTLRDVLIKNLTSRGYNL